MPQPLKGKHQSRHLVAAVTGTPWMIEEPVLQSIVELLELRAAGWGFTEDEIRERIGRNATAVVIDDGEQPAGPRMSHGIAVLPLQGVMAPRMNLMMQISGGTSTQQFAGWFADAMANEQVHTIVLDIDSPGGTAQGNEELAMQIRAARPKKRIIAVATGMMASAAYYVGSAAHQVIASPSTEVGSIGTYMVHIDRHRAIEGAGLQTTVIKGGPNKAMGLAVKELDANAHAQLQERINALYTQFVDAVAANRGVSSDHVLERFGQGKVMLAPLALQAGLIDRIATLDEVVAELATRPAGTSLTIRAAADEPATAPAVTCAATQEAQNMNQELKAALVKAGLTEASASDELAGVAIKSYCAAKGLDPQDEGAVIAALEKKPTPPAVPTPAPAGPSVASVSDAQTRAAERARIQDLNARAELLGVGPEALQQAIDGEWSVPVALEQWTRSMAGQRPTLTRPIVPGESANDKFAAVAEEVLLHRLGRNRDALSAAAQQQRSASLIDFASASLQLAGMRPMGDRNIIAEQALRGPDTYHWADGQAYSAGAEGGGYNRPGDFPNLLSNIAGKIMAEAYQFAPTTYRNWSYRLAPVPDFKPKTIIGVGEFPEFPVVPDGQNFEGVDSPNEERSFIQVDKYGQEFSLTPVMLVNDDLGALEEAARDNVIAAEMKLNRLCVNLLVGNVAAQDDVALFHANHGNIVGSPGAPDSAQLSAMRLLLRSQRGLSNQRSLNLTLWGLLIPEDIETVTQQLLSPSLVVVPTQDSNAQIFRGQVQWWVEPMIGEASTTYYYGFANPQIARSIVYCHQQGFETVRQRSYFNDKNQCRIYQYEARYASAIRDYRGVVQNPDT